MLRSLKIFAATYPFTLRICTFCQVKPPNFLRSCLRRYGFGVVHRDVKYMNRELKQWKRLVLACEFFGKPHLQRGKTTKHLGCPFRVNLNYRKKEGIVAVTLAVLTHNHAVPYVSRRYTTPQELKREAERSSAVPRVRPGADSSPTSDVSDAAVSSKEERRDTKTKNPRNPRLMVARQ